MIDSVMETLTGVFLLLTVVPLSRHEAWWVRVLDFPRLQLFAVLAVMLAGQLYFLDPARLDTRISLAINVACLLYHLWWIFPYTRLSPVEVELSTSTNPAKRIRILISNVLTTNRRADAFLALVEEHKPDLVIALETDAWWQSQLEPLEARYPYSLKCPLENLYGMHLYSKLPLENSAIQFLVEPDVPSMHTEVILRSGDRVRMHCLHPAPPVPHHTGESGERDAELLIVGKSVAESDSPIIVTGDLNDVAWSETTRLFRKISGLLDPRVGRKMLNTFHAGIWFFRWPLDHVFHSKHFKLGILRRLPKFGSDHFPVLVELVYEGESAGEQQQGLAADAEDHAVAEEKIEAQAVSEEDVHVPDK